MGNSSGVFALLLLAVAAANFPFVTRKLFGFIGSQEKTLPLRFIELVILYFVVGGLGLFLERSVGQIAPQGWEFYAVTGTLFVTLAFPGFVFRYLLKRHE
ncbi:DUF2818 family protein [Rhodoferax sp.]|uniref:DUF2818 family protein n=1 Tax=Rhodoferax sp. TaxID=50421 RepID=UPI0025EC5473|nr:DUF2818 family protein [Rhodoferax sp.]